MAKVVGGEKNIVTVEGQATGAVSSESPNTENIGVEK
eukprot:CAMPEP_0113958184 /NCGR_PEP_ID=MMETSP0011_2-20120614/3234_1 /TAXON_ID=101924 /ORGANISM="Rhodosorus marinus" /LENGTH=36 /DNA_ID=CAMNT_0000968929 /DNA_START=1 /DNA_END=111 /DNA_ORIENTATION=+ /assembly_acc=CAM_ASM_000156